MKIGIFDSGLGGLVIAKAFMDKLPQYDYVYFGDSIHLPYGEKQPDQVLQYTLDAMNFFIQKDCRLVILACNTASCVALRYIQQHFVPECAPNLKVLGVIVPTVEQALQSSFSKIGVVATPATIASDIYGVELRKINPSIQVVSLATPRLVPAIEKNDFVAAEKAIIDYAPVLSPLPSLILGCTHYPLIKSLFMKYLPNTHIISQDDFMGQKLADYLNRHPEIESNLTHNSSRTFFVSQHTLSSENVARMIFQNIQLTVI